ncbi:MAG: fused MFS/spermidine synthase, partial [Gammaproteobacteria bacterium]|nr:fused MFS/spermidine synthase [Gammaproteobacteria bacterium]
MIPQQKAEGLPVTLVLLLFFASGALALMYQVVWTRMMMHVFGSTAVAVGTVLAAFMSGMALGAWYFGKRADRSGNCLRLYALLEIGIAASALVSHLLLDQLGPANRAIFELVGSSPVLFSSVRFLLAFVLIMLPTVLMGATLPVLARFLLRPGTLVGVNLSTLYACNTFGAVAGVLATGFFLIGRYGIHVPVYLAVLGNLAIGSIALIASRRIISGAKAGTPAPALDQPDGPAFVVDKALYRTILFGLGLSGFTSFAYEIYWTRSLVFILGNSTYALTAMLSAFLTGIALGGYLVRFLIKKAPDRAAVFGWLQVLLGVSSVLALPLLFAVSEPQLLSQYLAGNAAHPFSIIVAGFGVAFLVMLIPATLIGATFPLVGQITTLDLRHTGSMVGKVYAVNTLGNVIGALLPGLFLLAWLGIQKGILAMALLNVSLGFVVLYLRFARSSPARRWKFGLPAFLLLSLVLLGQAPLQFQFPSDGERDYHETLLYREGPLATTKVFVNPRSGEKHISVDGIVIGGTGFSEFKQLLLAHLPKLLLDDVSTELSVGVGSGILLGESALHPRLGEITGVEIEPSVVRGAGLFSEENHDVMENPRLKIVVDDVSSFLRTSKKRYRVISADEKTADDYASNGFSYSMEYYGLLREHLDAGGLAIQWVPTTLPPDLYRMVLKTFSESFPHVQLWYFLPAHKRGPFNTILVGSNEPVPVRLDQIRRRFAESPEAWKSLAPYGLTSAEAVLPHFVAREDAILTAVENAPVNSLQFPRYEFYYPWDYARERDTQFIDNHALIIEMKRQGFSAFLASQELGANAVQRLRQTLAAEFRYLSGFQQFLEGMPLEEQYRVFDDALAVAPWNDSLRARIYA